MTDRAEYTRDEWTLLISAPQAAIAAVAFSDGVSFFETLAEAWAGAMAHTRGKERFAGNELVAALIGNTERIEPARMPQPQQMGESAETVRARLLQLASEMCHDVMVLLADRSNPEEATGYAMWVMDGAKAAALARRHRTDSGTKGPSVDAEEREALEMLADALGVEVGDLPRSDDEALQSMDPGAGAPPVPPGPINPS